MTGIDSMKDPVVSFIIPIFNSDKFLLNCLESIRNQSTHDIEIICIDDCSTDDSREIIQSFSLKDTRIKPVFFSRNRGAGEARNAGISIATGKYLRMIDADDYIPVHSTEILLYNLLKYNSNFVRGKYKLCDVNGQPMRTGWGCPDRTIPNASILNEKLLWRMDQHCTYLFQTDFLRSNGLYYDVNMRNGQDSAFMSDILPYLDHVTLIDETVYYYRFNPNSTMRRRKDTQYFLNVFSLYGKLFRELPQHDLGEVADYIFYEAMSGYFPQAILPAVISDIDKNEGLRVLAFLKEIIKNSDVMELFLKNKYDWQNEIRMPTEMRGLILLLYHDCLDYGFEIIKENKIKSEIDQALKRELDHVKIELENVYSSASWKISAPMRMIKRALSK